MLTTGAVMAYDKVAPGTSAMLLVAFLPTVAVAIRDAKDGILNRLKTEIGPQTPGEVLKAAWHRVMHKVVGATTTAAATGLGIAACFIKDPTVKASAIGGATFAGMYAAHSVADIAADHVTPAPPKAHSSAAASPA
jgi:hypothetical protein